MTLAEVFLILTAVSDRRTQDFERGRILIHDAAALNSFAYHDPKKMPKYKPIKSAKDEADDELAQAKVRGFFMGLAVRSNNP